MSNHPAANGKAMLVAWIDPVLRDYARVAARAAGVEFSKFVERAVQQAVAKESLARVEREIVTRAAIEAREAKR